MYKQTSYRQIGLADFNQPIGLKMNPENRWVKKAALIPWKEIENKYAKLFPSKTGMPAKPLRMALGSLLIQKQLGFSDRELVEEIRENPYFQYFIGLPGYQDKAPFAPSLLVEFRKRLNEDVLSDINEMILQYNQPDDPDPSGNPVPESSDPSTEGESPDNQGTMIIDATCAPQNIEFPQDINLLNESREDLEEMIDSICCIYHLRKPRTYRRKARKDYLNLARSRKRGSKKMRRAIRQQLQYIRRDLKYIEDFQSSGYKLNGKQKALLSVIDKVYEQQKYMYTNQTHRVPDRIVSISQPYIRPIVRGKARNPTEFGAKLDLSLDEYGMARIEKISFDPYNESDVLIHAAMKYHKRTGHYPERILADKIYRNRKNLSFCKEHRIRLSGPALGRPKKDQKADKKIEYIDNSDRIAIERSFAVAKHSYGLGLITTKLDCTTRSSIQLSIVAMNLNHLMAVLLYAEITRGFSKPVLQLMRLLIATYECSTAGWIKQPVAEHSLINNSFSL